MNQYLGKRILLAVGSNDAMRQAVVELISPNGKFVRLGGDRHDDEAIGWVAVADLKVGDVLGDSTNTVSQDRKDCWARVGEWVLNKQGVWEEVRNG